MSKVVAGNYFEDFHVGKIFYHATPRTITEGDLSLYNALYGNRFVLASSQKFAKDIGYAAQPIDDLLVFHIVFGKTVPDISLNAVANLGYAECRFLKPVYAGSTLYARSEVIGVKENSNGKTGVVYVKTTGYDDNDDPVLSYIRWVMVNKKDPASQAPVARIPDLEKIVDPQKLGEALPKALNLNHYNDEFAGSAYRFSDYEIGEKIDHVDGMSVEEAEHQIATRHFQNTAKVHFNQHEQAQGRFGKRLIYGGHVISLARCLSFNGLANAFHISAINAGTHIAPLFAGDTVYAWSEIVDKADLSSHRDAGLIRLKTYATKDLSSKDFPGAVDKGYAQNVILMLDYWAVMPK